MSRSTEEDIGELLETGEGRLIQEYNERGLSAREKRKITVRPGPLEVQTQETSVRADGAFNSGDIKSRVGERQGGEGWSPS